MHTPGPWRVERRHDGIPFGVSSPSTMRHDMDTLCLVPSGGEWADRLHELQANARLIAAAPDLLDTLRHALVVLKEAREQSVASDDNDPFFVRMAEQAIAKATGE